jgi:hypothetical protein
MNIFITGVLLTVTNTYIFYLRLVTTTNFIFDTLFSFRYENCGVKENWIADSPYKDRIVRMIPKFPNLIKFVGLENVNSNNLRDIIELVLGGKQLF